MTLTFLLILPFAVGALIVAVSAVRRRRRAAVDGPESEPAHRLQTETAAVQDAAVHPEAETPPLSSGRARRAGAANRTGD
jgi:hypothetical protein